TQSDVEGVAEAIEADGGRAIGYAADVKDLDALPGVVDRAVEEFGGLDILVNNAGGEISSPFLDTRVDHIREAIHFNVLVPFRAVAPGGPAPSRTPGRVHHQQQLDDD